MITATPFIEINGTEVPASLDAYQDEILALSGLSMDWGFDDYFSETEPTTLRFSLLDPTGEWAINRTLTGAEVRIGYRWGSGGSDWRYIFRGMITDAVMSPRSLGQEKNGRNGYIIDLNCIDRVGQLGNVLFNYSISGSNIGTIALVNAIKAAAGSLLDNITLNSNLLKREELTNASALTVLQTLYSGIGQKLCYDPHTNTIEGRSAWATKTQGFATLYKSENGLAKVKKAASMYNMYPHTWIDGGLLESGGQLSKDLSKAITDVSVVGYDVNDVEHTQTRTVNLPDASGIGKRTAALTTTTYAYSSTIADIVKNVAEYTYGKWTIEDPVWDVNRSGGFISTAAAQYWLTPVYNYGEVYLAGSALAQMPDFYPLYRLAGGQITYADGWKLALHLLPDGYDLNFRIPVTFDLIETENTTPLTLADFDESVRLSDFNNIIKPYKETWT